MRKLTSVVAEDFGNAGRIARGMLRGAVKGTYTPVLLSTGIRQMGNEIQRENTSIAEGTSAAVSQIITACVVHVPLATIAVSEGKGIMYFSALAVTNSVDYLANAYRRSKE